MRDQFIWNTTDVCLLGERIYLTRVPFELMLVWHGCDGYHDREAGMPRRGRSGASLARKPRSASGHILDSNTIKEMSMAERVPQQLHEVLRFFPPHHIGDPAVLLESILAQVETAQRRQVIGLYLDSLAAALEANLKFVQGVRSVITGTR